MKVMRSHTVGIMLPKEPPTRNAKLPHRLVSDLDKSLRIGVNCIDALHHDQNVDDRLGHDALDGRAADVMDVNDVPVHQPSEQGGLVREQGGPARIVRDEDDGIGGHATKLVTFSAAHDTSVHQPFHGGLS